MIYFCRRCFTVRAVEGWNAKAPRQKIHILSRSVSLWRSNQVLNGSRLSLTLSPSIFPSPNVSLTPTLPPGGLIEPTGRHGSLPIDRPAESLIPYPMAFITGTSSHTRISPLVRPGRWKERRSRAKKRTTTPRISANFLAAPNDRFFERKHVNHTNQITDVSRNKKAASGNPISSNGR